MDEPLKISIRQLFSVLELSTIFLDDTGKELVFQLFCAEMVGKVSEELLYECMKEIGYTKQDKCLDCNELVEALEEWDFKKDEDHSLCGRCHLEKTNPKN